MLYDTDDGWWLIVDDDSGDDEDVLCKLCTMYTTYWFDRRGAMIRSWAQAAHGTLEIVAWFLLVPPQFTYYTVCDQVKPMGNT